MVNRRRANETGNRHLPAGADVVGGGGIVFELEELVGRVFVMPQGFGVEVRGFPELEAGTLTLAEHIGKASRDSFHRVAEQAAATTRGRLHRDTGASAASVVARQTAQGASVGYGDGVPYAQYEEYGGRGWPQSSDGNFLYPSVRGVEPLLKTTAEQTAEQQIGAMSWPSP